MPASGYRNNNDGSLYNVGNLYKQVKAPNLVGVLSGHKEGCKAFNRYRMIDEETNRQTMSYLE